MFFCLANRTRTGRRTGGEQKENRDFFQEQTVELQEQRKRVKFSHVAHHKSNGT